MKRIIILIFAGISLFLSACKKEERSDTLCFVVSADYPPFEYIKNGELVGFDIDFATLVSEKLNKKPVFENIPFNAMMSAVQTGKADMAISTITITKDREKEFDFSSPYYFEKVAVIYKNESPVESVEDIHGKRISCLLGSVQEIWAKENIKDVSLTPLKHTNQAVESLKAGHVDAVVIDGVQAVEFVKNNEGLNYRYISEAKDGFAIAFKKGSNLKNDVNNVIDVLKKEGKIEELKQKWIG